ncbi:MAG: alpha,alpha-trehalase TreF [Saprospiraceae bacterium]|nr:alpha,alpha-trehalase TreF [Saprospiraceae bacterium]
MKPRFLIESLSPLYEDVQLAGIFPDSKYFPDCRPRAAAQSIVAAYQRAKQAPGFDLKTFVDTHFDPPHTPDTHYESAGKPLASHLPALWDVLTRRPDSLGGTLIPLPFPYIVPGGRFREVYYWDSYFTMLGLQVSGRKDLIQHMVDNFAFLIDTLGFIPNGNRTYYLGRSQPPFFVLMVGLLADLKGPETWMRYRPQLEAEYRFWMQGAQKKALDQQAHRRIVRLPDGSLLNRYWDDSDAPRPEAYVEDLHIAQQTGSADTCRHIRAAAESGWDFSSRWFADGQHMETIQTTHLIPVDLNCLLLALEEALAKIYAAAGEHAQAGKFQVKVARRQSAIQQYCWDEQKGFFFDFQFRTQAFSNEWTLAAVFPLFFRVATADQAARVAAHLSDKFLCPGGLRTTCSSTGQQWDAPNGWAPLQWIAYQGLRHDGHTQLAGEIRRRWMHTAEQVYARTGKMMEKYNVLEPELKAGGGEYPNQDGFGWTNGVYLRLSREK